MERAVAQNKPQEGLIFHSDGGNPYDSHQFRNKLDKYEFVSSMSRKGNCYDNAVAESFFGNLKIESVKFEEGFYAV